MKVNETSFVQFRIISNITVVDEISFVRFCKLSFIT